MKSPISDIAFSGSVKAAQERRGSRASYAKMEQRGGWKDIITADLNEFIAERDSFYMGTASADGQPYIQHRGGPKGFLKVLDEHTLAFADFGGNAQYISIGNLEENDKAFIFLMDYPNRRRIKIWGTAKVVEGDEELLRRLSDAEYKSRPQRVFVFTVEAWDANCPQHIKPRWTEEEISPVIDELRARVEKLEEENARLRNEKFEPRGRRDTLMTRSE
jgi:predicted pyridoxine 5'-phosphate oxidase superfamily flavin-nucleotide-binding protein